MIKAFSRCRWAWCCSLLLAPCLALSAQALPADGPPEWSDEPPVLSRMLEDGYAAQAAQRAQTAADLYCQAARWGSLEAQYRLGRLLWDNARDQERQQGLAVLALAAQRGHEKSATLLSGEQLSEELPACLMTGHAADFQTLQKAPGAETVVPHEVVERYVWALPPDKRRHAQLIQRLAPLFDVDFRFALAIARAESNFDPAARSPKNAQGLMQLIPDTAERFGVRNAFDPEQNVRGGLAYLRWLLKRFDGNVTLASAAYNAGEGAVDRFGGVPPYAETQEYVRRILHFYRTPRHQPPAPL